MSSRDKVWIVRPGDGETVADIVRRAGVDTSAIAQGRVFVGRRRVKSSGERVEAGDQVRIGAEAPKVAPEGDVAILFLEDDLVAVAKPAGIPTVPDHRASSHALVEVVARKIGKPVAALRITSRLDRDVSGAVVFALGEEAERRLKEARARGAYARRYVAMAATPEGEEASEGLWQSPIDDKPSETYFRRVARAHGGRVSMLAVDPVTGRTHQIRMHASRAGSPLLGDREYGGPAKLTLPNGRLVELSRIALHAARVVVPGRAGRSLVAEAEVPPELARVWSDLGGEADAWHAAVSSPPAQ